jgi:hypothetical protein
LSASVNVDIRSLHLLHVAGEYGIGTPVEAAATDDGHCAGVADHARRRDFRDDIGRAGNGDIIAEDRGQPLDAVDPVLKRNHPGARAYQRARLLAGGLGIPELYGEQDQVDRSDLSRVIGDIDVLEMKVAEGALDLEAIPANGIAMRAARDERHVVSGRGHPPAVIASHGACRHHRDPHPAASVRRPRPRNYAARPR